VKSLPPEKRAIWRTAFEHFVFERDGNPVAHLTPEQRGIQGPPSPQRAELVKNHLLRALSRGKKGS
jgi:hypothetical protein